MSVSNSSEALEGVISGIWEFATEVAVDDVDCAARVLMADRYGFTDATIHSSTIERAAAQGDRFIAVLERFRQAEVGA